jgi:hypothetical protein
MLGILQCLGMRRWSGTLHPAIQAPRPPLRQTFPAIRFDFRPQAR